MIEIFFESKNHAEKVGELEEEIYDSVYPLLETYAKEKRMILTERIK